MLLLAACYRYTPSSDNAPVAGTHVRLALNPATVPTLRRTLGEDAMGVVGRATSASDSAVTLAVAATLKRGVGAQSRIVWAGESVAIPRAAITSIELRSLDKKRTTRAAAIGAVAAVVAVRLIVGAVGSSGGTGDDGPVVTPP